MQRWICKFLSLMKLPALCQCHVSRDVHQCPFIFTPVVTFGALLCLRSVSVCISTLNSWSSTTCRGAFQQHKNPPPRSPVPLHQLSSDILLLILASVLHLAASCRLIHIQNIQPRLKGNAGWAGRHNWKLLVTSPQGQFNRSVGALNTAQIQR